MELNSISISKQETKIINQEEIGALLLNNSQIIQDGRKPVNVFCINCRTQVDSRIRYEKNKKAEADFKCRFWSVVLFATVFIIALIICGAVVGPTVKDKFILIGFGILTLASTVGGIYYFIAWLNANHGFENAFHYCPQCNQRLGYSNGNDRWQRYN
jgi:hypothetical protein